MERQYTDYSKVQETGIDAFENFLYSGEYIEKIFLKFGHAYCKPVTVPTDPNSTYQLTNKLMGFHNQPDEYPYKEVLGSLQFASIGTRPDISFAVSHAAQFSNFPTPATVTALKRILKYMKGTPQFSIVYRQGIGNMIIRYCNPYYASDLQVRKRRTCFLLTLNSGPIAWGSRKQSCVSSSTAEAEYIAMHTTTLEIIWHRRLLNNLGRTQTKPTILFSDN